MNQVFAWYLEGVSALRISQRLNEAAVPLKTARTARAHPWTKDLVLRVLRNRIYLGELSCQGEFVAAEHPALIEPEVFDRVQRMLEPKVRRDRHSSRNPVYLVRGTLKCGLCGASMTSASTFRDGRLYRYYRCSTRDKQGKEVCSTVQMSADAIESYVVNHVQRRLEQDEVRQVLGPHLERFGICRATVQLDSLWEILTLENQQRLVRLLVEEVRVDQRAGRLAVRLRDLAALEVEEGAAC